MTRSLSVLMSRSFTLSSIVLLAFVLGACAGQGTPQATGTTETGAPAETGGDSEPVAIRFTFDWTPDAHWAAMMWADQLGYFADEGVSVDWVAGDDTSLQAMAGGAFDIATLAGTTALQAFDEGLPITVVGLYLPRTANAFVADADIIQGPADVEGTKVGVQFGEHEEFLWYAWAERHGIDRTTIEELPVAGQSDLLFIEGQIDMHIGDLSSGIPEAELRPGEETVFPIAEDVPVVGKAIVVHNDFLRDHPEAVERFLSAWAKGVKYMIDNESESVDLIMELDDPDLGSREKQEITADWYVQAWTSFWGPSSGGIFSFTDDDWEATRTLLIEGDQLSDIDFSEHLNTEFLPDPPVYP